MVRLWKIRIQSEHLPVVH